MQSDYTADPAEWNLSVSGEVVWVDVTSTDNEDWT
jgi:hypothetical protein